MSFELLESVFGYLQLEDIKSTRHEAASLLLLKPAWVSSDAEDQKILTATASHQIFRETVPEIAYYATMNDESFSDEGFKRSGHQYGHSQIPSLSQVFGNTDNAVITTYAFDRKEDNTKHRVITGHHLS